MTPREQLQAKQAMMIERQAVMIDKQAKMIEKQAGIIGRLGPLPWTIGEMTAPLQKRPAWCAKRRQTPRQEVQLGATDVAAETTTSLHQLETREERPCPESGYDQNEDAGAASTLDMGPDARAESSTDQQQPQDRQDEIDEMKDTMSTFEADVKNTFAEIANNQEECDQDFKKIRARLKNLNRDMCRMRMNARRIEVMTGGRFKVPEVPRNEQMSMEALLLLWRTNF